MEPVRFLGVIKDSVSAIKIDGGGNGGEVVIQAPELSLPEFLKLSLMRKMVLKITVEVTEDTI